MIVKKSSRVTLHLNCSLEDGQIVDPTSAQIGHFVFGVRKAMLIGMAFWYCRCCSEAILMLCLRKSVCLIYSNLSECSLSVCYDLEEGMVITF